MKGVKRLKAEDLKRGMLVEEYMADGTWRPARIVSITKRKTQFCPNGRVVIDVLRGQGAAAVAELRDEIDLHEVGKYLRLPNGPEIPRVDLLNASPQTFCETLSLAAKIGTTDAMVGNDKREEYELAELLCVSKHYLYEHVRALYEAYESGLLFIETRGKKPPWSLTPKSTPTDTGWRETAHGRYRVRMSKGGD